MVICPTWPLNALHSIRPVYLCDFDLIFVVFHCILCLQYAASYRLKFSGKLKLVQDKFQKVMQIISTEQVVSSTAWQNMYFLDCLVQSLDQSGCRGDMTADRNAGQCSGCEPNSVDLQTAELSSPTPNIFFSDNQLTILWQVEMFYKLHLLTEVTWLKSWTKLSVITHNDLKF